MEICDFPIRPGTSLENSRSWRELRRALEFTEAMDQESCAISIASLDPYIGRNINTEAK